MLWQWNSNTTVKGIDICLDPVILREILHLSYEGYSNMELPVKEEGINMILGGTYLGSLNKLKAKILSCSSKSGYHSSKNPYPSPKISLSLHTFDLLRPLLALVVEMAPKMKLPQRRKSVCELEEGVRRKRQASQTSSASIPVSASAPGSSRSPLSPNKILLSVRKVELGKNVDFRFFEKEGFSIGSKIKDQGWGFYC